VITATSGSGTLTTNMSSYGPTPTASSNAGDIDNVAAAVQSSDPESLTPARKKLRGLGYDFNDEGILRQFKSGKLTNKKFEFRDQVSSYMNFLSRLVNIFRLILQSSILCHNLIQSEKHKHLGANGNVKNLA
jgi:hypothetical protein